MDDTRIDTYTPPASRKDRAVLHMERPKVPYMQIDGGHKLSKVYLIEGDFLSKKHVATKTKGKGKSALEHAVEYVLKYGKQNRIYEYKIHLN